MKKIFLILQLLWFQLVAAATLDSQCHRFYKDQNNSQSLIEQRIRLQGSNPENIGEIVRIKNNIIENNKKIKSYLTEGRFDHLPSDIRTNIVSFAKALEIENGVLISYARNLIKGNAPQIQTITYLLYFSRLQEAMNLVEQALAISSQSSINVWLKNKMYYLPNLNSRLSEASHFFGDPFQTKYTLQSYLTKEFLIRSQIPEFAEQDLSKDVELLKSRSPELSDSDLKSAALNDRDRKANNHALFPNNYSQLQMAALHTQMQLSLFARVNSKTYQLPFQPLKIRLVESHAGDKELIRMRHKNVAVVGYTLKGKIDFDGTIDGTSDLFTLHDLSHQDVITESDARFHKLLNARDTPTIETLNRVADAFLNKRVDEMETTLNPREQGVVAFVLNLSLFEIGRSYPFLAKFPINSLEKHIKGSLRTRIFNPRKLIFGQTVASFTKLELEFAQDLVQKWIATDAQEMEGVLRIDHPDVADAFRQHFELNGQSVMPSF